jgi:diketogulonate reductase-like aldo/keto reductase
MKRVALPSGESVPALGQGTWQLGDDPAQRKQEIASLQRGIELGLTLIDTAEMYGEGRSETLVGEAIQGRRSQVFLVTKVYPHNASRRAMQNACDNSLRRLHADTIDLYLLHWPGGVPLEETVDAFGSLQRDGKIRHWGVSNFDLDLTMQLQATPGGPAMQANQVLYNLGRRGIEWDLLPWQRSAGIPVMAYSPIEQGRLLRHRRLTDFARKRGTTPAQVALAWLLAQDGVIAIPKTGSAQRVEENAGALALALSAADLRELDRLFPPPDGPGPLEMI